MHRNSLLQTTSRINYAPADAGSGSFIPDSRGEFGPRASVPSSGDRRGDPENRDTNDGDKKKGEEDNGGDNDYLWSTLNDDNGDKKDDVTSDDETKKQTPEEFWNEHVKELGLSDAFNKDEIKNDLAEGNLDSLVDGIQQAILSAYKANLTNTGNFVKNTVSSLKDELSQNMESKITARDFRNRLHQAIPILKTNPNVAPVGEAAFQQLLKKNNGDFDKAVLGTKKFLDSMRNASAVDLGLPEDTRNAPGSHGYNQTKAEDEIDYMDVLRGN